MREGGLWSGVVVAVDSVRPSSCQTETGTPQWRLRSTYRLSQVFCDSERIQRTLTTYLPLLERGIRGLMLSCRFPQLVYILKRRSLKLSNTLNLSQPNVPNMKFSLVVATLFTFIVVSLARPTPSYITVDDLVERFARLSSSLLLDLCNLLI